MTTLIRIIFCSCMLMMFNITGYSQEIETDTIPSESVDQQILKLEKEAAALKLEVERLRSQELEGASKELENANEEESDFGFKQQDAEDREKKRNDFFSYHDDDNDIHFDLNFKNKSNFRVGLLDIGFSGYAINNSANLPTEYDILTLKYPGSLNVNLHLFRHRLKLIGKSIFIEYGLSVNWKHYKFENDFRLETDAEKIIFVEDEVTYRKNKLRTSFLEMPVMLTFDSPKSGFHCSLGFYNGMRIGSNQKLKSENFGKEKIKNDFNLRSFNSGFVGRIGFGAVDFYLTADANSLFKENALEDAVMPFTIGVALVGF